MTHAFALFAGFVLLFLAQLAHRPAIACSNARLPTPGAYVSLLPLAGCTPKLEKFGSGVIAWAGCPTWACGVEDACQIEGTVITTCKCRDAGWDGVLCQGVVSYDQYGLVVAWECFVQACENSDPAQCFKTPEPAGAQQFFVCDC